MPKSNSNISTNVCEEQPVKLGTRIRRRLFKSNKLPQDIIKRLKHVCVGLTPQEFTTCWNAYDTDRNGFIEGKELKSFVRDLVTKALRAKVSLPDNEFYIQNPTEAELIELQKKFLEEFDLNKDGKIEIGEMAQILEPEENFLAIIQYELPLMSGYDFLTAWTKFSKDKRFVTSEEIKEFLTYLFQLNNKEVEEDKITEYVLSLIELYDSDNDGQLSFKEMSRIIAPEENYMIKFKNNYDLKFDTFCSIFHHYDKNGDGLLEENELLAFIRDVLKTVDVDASEKSEEIEKFRNLMLKMCDKNHDGIFQKEELALWLGVDLSK